MNCLAWLRKRVKETCGKYENINYMIVTQDLVNNSILGLHLGRGMVSSVKMVNLFRMVSLVRMVRLVRMVS